MIHRNLDLSQSIDTLGLMSPKLVLTQPNRNNVNCLSLSTNMFKHLNVQSPECSRECLQANQTEQRSSQTIKDHFKMLQRRKLREPVLILKDSCKQLTEE